MTQGGLCMHHKLKCLTEMVCNLWDVHVVTEAHQLIKPNEFH